MDPSGVEVKKGIKNEIIELFDVSIQNGIKSVVEFRVKKEIKDDSEVIDKLDLSIKNEIQEGIRPYIETKKEVPVPKSDSSDDSGVGSNQSMGGETVDRKSTTDNYAIFYTFDPTKSKWAIVKPAHLDPTNSSWAIVYPAQTTRYCALCRVSVPKAVMRQHVNGKKHKKKRKKKKKNSSGLIIPDIKFPFYCVVCQCVAIFSENRLDDHLSGRKHKENERNVAKKNELPKGATMFMEGFKNDTRKKDIKKALMVHFDVEGEVFASIKKEQTCCYVRFREENAAVKLVTKIEENVGQSKMLKIKELDIKVRVLEGREETEYLDHAPGSLKMMNRNKKRAFYQSERNKHLNGIKQKIFYPMQK